MKHPNIVELLAYALSEEEIVLVTNFIDGSNLDKILFAVEYVLGFKLSEQQELDIAIKVADAVHYMHSQDPIVIHQDLKPQNVLVSTINDIKIIIILSW